jgi:hypothetical protein
MKWKNITVRLGDLKPWADNPRMSTKKQAERILASFKKFGQVYPIAIGPKMEVYDGHQRLSALLTIHDENYQIEARKLERCLTDKELREFVILMNGTAMGQFDWDSLANWDAKELIDFGMDEDILHQFNNDAANLRELLTGDCFAIVEEFVERYTNIALAGLQYEFFFPALQKQKPFLLNTRIYSCILIKNDIPYRWRGRYNEDTDLSLRALKDGYCTFLSQQFICKKITTMQMKGGNTDELYRQDLNFDGRLEMAKSLQRQHPEVTTIKWKWGRWQHVVNYKPFANNRLILKKGVKIKQGIDNHGLVLKKLNPSGVPDK